MDPNETLRRIRKLIDQGVSHERADELFGLVEDLDQWLSRGGFLPDGWSRDQVERAVANSL